MIPDEPGGAAAGSPARPWWSPPALGLVAAAAAAAVYLAAGVLHGYLATDDFQWLLEGQAFTWMRLAHPGVRHHFYRPVVEIWFAGTTSVCGTDTACYHAAGLLLHVVNALLVFAAGRALARSTWTGLAGALLFAAQPGCVEAVTWVSAQTILLATAWYVAALGLFVRSWSAGARATRYELAALGAAALALLSHEAAATIFVVAWLANRWCGPPRRLSPLMRSGSAGLLTAFALVTWVANRRNYVFTDGVYGFGGQSLRHAFDYLVSFWAGPHAVVSYVITVAVVIALAAVNRFTRLAAVWLGVTLVPYLGFSGGVVSRYGYLPAIGFAWLLAGAVSAAWPRVARAAIPVRRIATIVLVLFGMRSAWFTLRDARGALATLEPSREYVQQVLDAHPPPPPNPLVVPAPENRFVEPDLVEPMLRWVYQQPDLRVRFMFR